MNLLTILGDGSFELPMANAIQKRALLFAVATLLGVPSAFANTQTFQLGGDRLAAKQSMSVESDAEFENFTSTTNKITGVAVFDPKAKRGSAKITVDLSSVQTGISLRDEHMRGEKWFDTTKFPSAVLETTTVKHVSGDKYRVTGKLTIKGVTKTITTDATVRYLPESEGTKAVGLKGNGIQIRTAFNFNLSDFGIVVPDNLKTKVANTQRVRIVVFGQNG